MRIFKPTFIREGITDVTVEMLREHHISTVLLDVDNTLVSYRSHMPVDGATTWVEQMKEAGFDLVIVSNNIRERVKPIAEIFGLPFVTVALKPLPIGYIKAKRMFGVKAKYCAIIGDQIFTDIVGANLSGMHSILLSPVEREISWSFRVRRALEDKLKRRY